MNDDFRPLAEFPGYVVSAVGEVWSVGREVKAKGGGTRTTAAKRLKPDDKNRVALRHDGKTFKINVYELAANAYPPTRHYVALRWVTLTCRWCRREFRDISRSWCENAPTMWPDLHRCPHCTTAVNKLPGDYYFPTPP